MEETDERQSGAASMIKALFALCRRWRHEQLVRDLRPFDSVFRRRQVLRFRTENRPRLVR